MKIAIDMAMRNIGDRHDPYAEETVTVWDGKTKLVESVDSSLACTSTIRFYNHGIVVRELVIDHTSNMPYRVRRQLKLKVNLLVKRATDLMADHAADNCAGNGRQGPAGPLTDLIAQNAACDGADGQSGFGLVGTIRATCGQAQRHQNGQCDVRSLEHR